MSFYNTQELDKENNNFIYDYFESDQSQMNSQGEASKMTDNQNSVIKKLLYNDCPFNMQMSEYQKKLLLNENSRLTMKAASIITNQQQSQASDYKSASKKSVQRSNYKSGSTQFSEQQLQQIQQQQLQQLLQQQDSNKNIWDELYEKGLKKKMMIDLQMKQGEQEKIDTEEQELTFQPKLVADNTLFNIKQPFQERNNNWQDAKNKRLAEIKKYYTESEDYRETKECTFQPQILNKSRQMTYEKTKKQETHKQVQSQQQQQENMQSVNSCSKGGYKQMALNKQEFHRQKDLLRKQLYDLNIDL